MSIILRLSIGAQILRAQSTILTVDWSSGIGTSRQLSSIKVDKACSDSNEHV